MRGLAAFLGTAVVATACGGADRPPSTATLAVLTPPPALSPGPTAPAAGATPPIPTPTAPATSCVPVATWSVARLAAATVVVPVDEANVGSTSAEAVAGVGGLLLFGSSSPAGLGQAIAAVQAQTPGRLGLLVMTDEEGGGVQRMANLVGSLPWARDMGASWSQQQITSHVAAVASAMVANGVTVDLAPVVDVDGTDVAPGVRDPDGWRSFSGTTSVVSADGAAYVRGLRQGGVIAVLKHFPGLGGATGNTDDGPADTLPWPTLQADALAPFVAGIAAGAQAVMVSNATVPGLTTGPASLSRSVVEDELVGALHFHGLVLSDTLSDGAVARAGYTAAGAAVQAIAAGVDMVMFGPPETTATTLQMFDSVVDAEVAAVASGAMPLSRLVAAVTAVFAARGVRACS